MMDDDREVREWERRSSVPLLASSLLFLTAYAVLVLAPALPSAWRAVWLAVLVTTWAGFLADYLARLALSRRRLRFVRARWLDLVVLAWPLLRPLRMVETFAAAERRRGHAARLTLEAQVIVYSGLTTLLLGFSASLGVYRVEHGAAGANIRTFGDSVWWACSTLTAVGYGDVYPVTTGGRVIGVGLMFTGLGLLGSVMGTFSSWLVNRFRLATREGGSPPDRGSPRGR